MVDERGFVFLDVAHRPFWCRRWENQVWLFYLNNQQWVSLKQVTDADADSYSRNLREDEQELHRKLVKK